MALGVGFLFGLKVLLQPVHPGFQRTVVLTIIDGHGLAPLHLLIDLIDTSGRKAGDNANGGGGQIVRSGELRHDEHAEDAKHRAKRTADDGNPLIVQRAEP